MYDPAYLFHLLRFKVFRVLATASVVALLTACATPPSTYNVANSRSYTRDYDLVWEDVVQHLASNNIQIKNIAKDSGVIYGESARFDERFADCGTPGIFQVIGRRVNFNIFINRSTKQPIVSVNTEFIETRRFDTTVNTVQCNSKGVLETAILNSIKT